MLKLKSTSATCVALTMFAGLLGLFCPTGSWPKHGRYGYPRIARETTEHRRHHGRRHRLVEHRGLSSGHDGRQDAASRHARQRGHEVHRLLRRSELHGGSREFHHRSTAHPYGHDHRRPGRRQIGLPAEACTIATALKDMGYATGQFGKNHLGDLNEFLPTVHGFDEFFGYLYHLDAMEDPAHPAYPQQLLNVVGPRNMVHSWATNTDDATVKPRWGKIGKQKIEDAGTLYPKRMETVDDEILDFTLKFMDKAKADDKPFFVWLNPTRMHIVTHLSPKYEAMRN